MTLTGIHWVDVLTLWAMVVATVGGAFAFLWRHTRPARRLIGELGVFLEAWNGTPARPGIPARPGLLERVGALEAWRLAHMGTVEEQNRQLSTLAADVSALRTGAKT